MKYLHWNEKTITDFSPKNISDMYDRGYVFTRLGEGVMHQTRSVRIDLKRFKPSSENRRVIRKGETISIETFPIPYQDYKWEIAKMAKTFYEIKADSAFSANKIKEIIKSNQNFNTFLIFKENNTPHGYAICYENSSILHYSYPFYDLETAPKDMGLIMMNKVIADAKSRGLSYVYLGSLQRPTDTYKLQFEGLEWFDSKGWSNNIEKVKKILSSVSLYNGKMQLPKKIHVIGICGVATSALAIAFHEKGVVVTGSDKGFFPPILTELEKHKVPFYAGWHPEKMIENGKPDTIVVGTASGSQNPETAYAKENNIPIYSFAEAIGKFFAKEKSLVCVGTWGKTSSSAMLSFILEKSVLNPTYMFGGVSLSHDASAKLTDSKWSVFEGDEYKSSPTDPTAKFFYYKPTHLLLTAISWDHADLYPTEKDYFNAFEKLIASIPKDGLIITNTDNSGVVKLIGKFTGKVISYGKSGADYTYENIRQTKNGLDFIIKHNGRSFNIHSSMIGAFQAENIAGCFAMAHSVGISPDTIMKAIGEFQGLKRRLEKRLDGGITIFDDIAHSPEKASSVLQNLRSIYKSKIIAVFEPNIGGRSRESIVKYDNAFKDADMIIIPRLTKLKILDNETNQPIEGDELVKIIGKTHPNVQYIDNDEDLVKYLKTELKKDDVIVFLGSHGFRGMIEEMIRAISPHQQSPS